MFREDFDIQQSDVALLALLACCTQEISTLNDYLSKFSIILFHRLTLVLPTRVIFDPVLHITVVDKSNCLLLSMNISTGRAEIFIANRPTRGIVNTTNLSSIISNVTELSENF
jgi:hypothetical protein